jgi:hypothetical protein
MPIKTDTNDGITTQRITVAPDKPSATITIVAGDKHNPSHMSLTIEGTKGEKAPDIKEKLGIKGDMQSHHARSSLLQYEVPRSETAAVLQKVGLPANIGGKEGVSISFGLDTTHHRSTSITITARDTKAPPFTIENIDQLTTKLAQAKDVLPDSVRTSILKENPHLVARVTLAERSFGGTRIELTPIDAGNLPFSMRHDAKTGEDKLVLPATNDQKAMQELNARVMGHLSAKGVAPIESNIASVLGVKDTDGALGVRDNNVQSRTGGLQITLPKGAGEKALMALSQAAEFTVGNVSHHSKPIVAPEVAKLAIPEMAAVVRPVAAAEHEAHVASQKTGGKAANFGNILTRLGIAGFMSGAAGLAAAAQAPEGKRLEAGAKAAGTAMAENALPGITQVDTCNKWGASVGAVGGAVGAVVGGGGAIIATGATALPTLGASVAASPWTTTAGVLLGGAAGSQLGEILGEAGCKLARDAIKAMSPENKAQIVHKPTEQTVASTKIPDTTRAVPSHGTASGRG